MTRLQGHSCEIGNMRLLGTVENQNGQFHEICYFCLIFTPQQSIKSSKYDGQPYCTFYQTFVPHLWKFYVPRRHKENYAVCLAKGKHFFHTKELSKTLYDVKMYIWNQSFQFSQNLRFNLFAHSGTTVPCVSLGQYLEIIVSTFK